MDLTREDFSVIFPSNENFLVGSRLYKIARNAHTANEPHRNTNSLLDEKDDLSGSMISSTPISPSTSRTSTPISRKSVSSNTFSESGSLKRKKGPDERDVQCLNSQFFRPAMHPYGYSLHLGTA